MKIMSGLNRARAGMDSAMLSIFAVSLVIPEIMMPSCLTVSRMCGIASCTTTLTLLVAK